MNNPEDLKYYTPTIEDIKYGLPYDLHIQNRWFSEISNIPLKVSLEFGHEYYQSQIDKKEIRVKYLDRKDIESTGFIFDPVLFKNMPEYDKCSEQKGFNRYSKNNTYWMQHYVEDDTIVLADKMFIIARRIRIKNILEFRELLDRFNIK